MESASSSNRNQSRGRTAIGIQARPHNSVDYTHFISLPLAIHHELIDKLVSFQWSILGVYAVSYAERQAIEKKNKELGIDKSIFVNPKTFHLTVLMLRLENQDRVAEATQILQSTYLKVIKALENRPIFISLKGLDLMRGSINEARVVYAPVEEIGGEGRLLQACKVIIDAYMKAGLVLENDAKKTLKLHATIMNAKFRKRHEGGQKRDSFDAENIFKVYESRDWGEYIIRGAHLSQRFAYDENGYYYSCASIPFLGGHSVGQQQRHRPVVSHNSCHESGQGRGIDRDQFQEQSQGRGRGRGRMGNNSNVQDEFLPSSKESKLELPPCIKDEEEDDATIPNNS